MIIWKRSMAAKLKVLIDTHVILDVLQKREPFFEASAKLLAAVETGKIKGYVAAHTITTLFYLVRKESSNSTARVAITNMLQFLQVAPVTHQIIEQALNLDTEDFEDAVQMIAAVHSQVDMIVTRNLKDYPGMMVPVTQPVDLLGAIYNTKDK